MIAPLIFAFEEGPENTGRTVEPYVVLSDGIKLRFDQIDRQYLGRKCSVYFKRGHPLGMSGTGIEGKNQFVWRNGILIENGELAGISKNSVDVVWYFVPYSGHGGAVLPEDVDYIIVEKK